MNWYLEVLKKYAVFTGRAGRPEYWYFTLFNALIVIFLAVLDVFGGLFSSEIGAGLLTSIYGLATLIPNISVTARRLHDINRSGWWMLIYLVPLIGFIVMLIFTVKESDAGFNAYGPNPN